MYYDTLQRTASIQSCWDARNTCQDTLFSHVKLMLDCIAMCQVTADCMTRHSEMFDVMSDVCSKVCQATAESCERIGGAEMMRCAEACLQCSNNCRANYQESRSIDAA
ncbi:MAG: hypothetical protein B7X02_00660 [Rhodospirillales bacterium 12-54-5]|nr:MAG: hypothetical protein B7X02_00660 [Rhodospirillales bacterium 12-54-5]